MFVKKLIDKATIIKPVENSESLKSEDVDPRLAFHYGIPSSASVLAYDPVQNILAISTKNGLIKLIGKDNTQALLESNNAQPSKFLQFIQNKGFLLNVTFRNQIEVWDIDKKVLCHVHDFHEEITSFSIMQQSSFIFIGDHNGNVTVWKLNEELSQIEKMNYWIPFSASHGCTNKDLIEHAAVSYIMPQPNAESKRILIIFSDGLITLWGIKESKALFTIGGGGNMTPMPSQEIKRVTSACWICPLGSKFAVGYDTGDILVFTLPSNLDTGNEFPVKRDSSNAQTVHTSKINLGYRLEKIPIASLKWVYSDGKADKLYVIGAFNDATSNLVQVILLNDDTESRMIKLGLQLSEPCVDLDIIYCPTEHSKHKPHLLLLGKSGIIYAYDDQSIEKCLLQSQSKSSASLPSEWIIKLPYSASNTTCAQFITSYSNSITYEDEEFKMAVKNYPSVLPSETKNVNLPNFTGFAKIKNLYITGHGDGTIRFWDVRFPLLIPLLSLTQQSEDDISPSGIEVTAVHYCSASRLLFSGDKSGMVRIYQFKADPFSTENGFFSLPGSSKKGNNHVVQSVKCIKVNGSVLSFSMNSSSKHLAVGSDQGHISVIDLEGSTILYQKKIGTELSADVISLKFESLHQQGFEKHTLVITTRDSSLLALDADTGNTFSNSIVRPKKPFRALFMQILESNKGSSTEETAQKQQLLLCSEKAVYIFSFAHIIQGVKKVFHKKKFHSSCCWASTFSSTSSTGLILLFSCGKFEIRSLPDLSLLKEATIRSFVCLPWKPNVLPDYVICSSDDGDVIMMRSNQEVSVASMLLHNEKFRDLDTLYQVYDKNYSALENGATSTSYHKEKKKGMFGTLFKDVSGSKTNHGADTGALDEKAFSEELFKSFSVFNFPTEAESSVNTASENDNVDLDIDDIDLDDQDDKPKGNNMMTMLNKQKLASKFNSFKGKLKQIAMKNEKPSANEEPHAERTEAVDQIKKKYGFSPSGPNSETSVAKMIESKLTENVKKLQGISLKTTEMKDNAQTFSDMAKETLRLVEQKNNPSKAS